MLAIPEQLAPVDLELHSAEVVWFKTKQVPFVRGEGVKIKNTHWEREAGSKEENAKKRDAPTTTNAKFKRA
jgi:hypothetical protein